MSEKSRLYSLKNVGNCSNGGIKYKLSALLYISYLEEIKYYESTSKPLIVALILLDVYYFDAESSKKKLIVTGKIHKITYFSENRWRPFCNLSFAI